MGSNRNRSNQQSLGGYRHKRVLGAGLLMGCVVLISCSAPRSETMTRDDANNAPSSSTSESVAGLQSDTVAKKAVSQRELQNNPTDTSSTAPQLIKKANLTLRVGTVATSIQEVSRITRTERGDLLNLQDRQPQVLGERHIATLIVRVPQENLDRTLAQFKKLGKVQEQSIQAQDVSNQIVDSEARLRNLRKSETVVLGIMEKSGSIPNVLTVSKELSQIRERIEKHEAQLKSLKIQVSYSSINLQLQGEMVGNSPKDGLGERLNETWTESTHALGEFLTNILSMGIWIGVFSPFFLLIALGAFSWRKYSKNKPSSFSPPPLNPLLTPTQSGGKVTDGEPEQSIND